jgi:hypothetical protein
VVRQRYQAVTDSNVTVVNFHAPTEKRSLIEQFVCDALHGMAPHACRAAKTYVPTKINARYSLDADFVLARALATNRIPSVNQTDDASIPNTVKDTQVLLACINKKYRKATIYRCDACWTIPKATLGIVHKNGFPSTNGHGGKALYSCSLGSNTCSSRDLVVWTAWL